MRKLFLVLILSIPSTTFAQDYRVNEERNLAWDYTQANIDVSQTIRFEVRLDSGIFFDTELPVLPPGTYEWPLPELTVGGHVVRVRACNSLECGSSAMLSFNVLAMLPPPPTNLRIPPGQVVSLPRAIQLAESYSFVRRLHGLSQGEMNFLANNYQGDFTYSNIMNYLDESFTKLGR